MTNSYDRIAAKWHTARQNFRTDEEKFILKFLENLPEKSKILDLGCGTAVPIGNLIIRAGHSYTGVDSSAKMLDIAKKELPDGIFLLADVREIKLSKLYEGIICWDSVFFHLNRNEHAGMLKKIYKMLQSHGKLIFTTGGSDHLAFTDSMFGEKFFYDAYPPEQTITLIEEAGFRIITAELIEKPDGNRNKGRLVVIAEKRD